MAEAQYAEVCKNNACTNTTNLKSCSACNMVKYCSVDCQKADLQLHKLICGMGRSIDTQQANTDSQVLSAVLDRLDASAKEKLTARENCLLVLVHSEEGKQVARTAVLNWEDAIPFVAVVSNGSKLVDETKQVQFNRKAGYVHGILIDIARRVVANYSFKYAGL